MNDAGKCASRISCVARAMNGEEWGWGREEVGGCIVTATSMEANVIVAVAFGCWALAEEDAICVAGMCLLCVIDADSCLWANWWLRAVEKGEGEKEG